VVAAIKSESPSLAHYIILYRNCIDGVIVSVLASSVLASSVLYRWFEPQLDQTKDYRIGICYFSTKHPALRRKSKDWLAWNQNNMSELGQHVYPRTVSVS
jgi:hypothetical protein